MAEERLVSPERQTEEASGEPSLRPRRLDEYIGQEHIVGEGKLWRWVIEAIIARAKPMGSYSVWITRRVSKAATSSVVQPDTTICTLHELPVLLCRLMA